ncbi:MAG: hypothetical protein CSB06_01560 [Bacteroidia bacterium]|nr:MAG: hypothetical protein CSB06_01560 [Bacteroidia bacterium]
MALYFFEKQTYMIYPVILIIGVYIFLLLRKSDYFFLQLAGDKIIVRFYTAHPFGRRYRALEIPSIYFDSYEIRKQYLGIRTMLYLKTNTPQGRFLYPPLSLALLSADQIKATIQLLDSLKKTK